MVYRRKSGKIENIIYAVVNDGIRYGFVVSDLEVKGWLNCRCLHRMVESWFIGL